MGEAEGFQTRSRDCRRSRTLSPERGKGNGLTDAAADDRGDKSREDQSLRAIDRARTKDSSAGVLHDKRPTPTLRSTNHAGDHGTENENCHYSKWVG